MGSGKQCCELSVVKIISQNVHSLTGDKEEELLNRFRTCDIWAACLQETWKEPSTRENQNHVFINHGPAAGTCNKAGTGVAIVLSPQANKCWEASGSSKKVYGPRILSIKLKTADQKGREVAVVLVSAYAPHSKKTSLEQEEYLKNLEECINDQSEKDVIIIGNDANARLEKKTKINIDDGVCGLYGSPADSKTGKKLREILSYNHLCSATTFFKKKYLSTTWRGLQIDHFFVQKKDMKRIKNAGIGWNGVDSDHKALTLIVRIAKTLHKNNGSRLVARKKLDLALFRNTVEMQKQFNESLKIKYQNLTSQQTNTDEGDKEVLKIDLLKTCMKQAGEEVIPILAKKRKEWFKEKAGILEPLIKKRNDAMKEHTKSPSNVTKKRLQSCRKKVKVAVALARRTWYSNLTEIICNRADKYTVQECWDAIRLLERGESSSKPYRPMQFKKPDGSMCQSTEENRDVVKNQLDEMFNKESTFDQSIIDKIKLRPLRPELDKKPNKEEIKRAVNGLSSGKASGDDGIPAEYYKALLIDDENYKLMVEAVQEIWMSGAYKSEVELVKTVEELDKEIISKNVKDAHELDKENKKKIVQHFERKVMQRNKDRDTTMRHCQAPSGSAERITLTQRMNERIDKAQADLQAAREVYNACLDDAGPESRCETEKDDMKELLDRAKHEDWQIEYIQRNPYAASSHDKTRYEKYKIALRSAKNMVWIHGHSLPREAIFSILRRYGLPDHFVNVRSL
mmetsp:Transcript_27933/g.36102  ORF Transcript_27933/g.36102 Transcript_27933/m.36102 type:complete len:740 (+) Transcript_27933:123-2342(+)